MSEEDIKSVFEAFGAIVFCKLAANTSPGSHKGYGFIEYSTNQAALESIASMNLFDLGGQLLRVGRSITPPNAVSPPPISTTGLPTAAAVAAAAATAKIQAMDAVQANVMKTLSTPVTPASTESTQLSILSTPVDTEAKTQLSSEELMKQKQEELQKKLMEVGEPTLQQQESMSIKGQNARHLVMQRLMRPRESKIVILRNMVGSEDVDETLQEEIQDECSKFGSVDKVIIYKEKQGESDDFDDTIVKIFVEFSMISGELLSQI